MVITKTCASCAAVNNLNLLRLAQSPHCGACRRPLVSDRTVAIASGIGSTGQSLILGIALSLLVIFFVPLPVTSVQAPDPGLSAAPGADDPGAPLLDTPLGAGAASEPGTAITLPSQPAPAQGVVRLYSKAPREAPLRIVTPEGSESYFIKLVSADDSNPVMTLFMGGGETLETRVPLGSLNIRYASGQTWYGEDELFGADTQFSEATHTFDFVRDSEGVSGFTIELIKQLNGNLRTATIAKDQF